MTGRFQSLPRVQSKMVYHGTVHEFDTFDPDRSGLGTHFGTKRAALFRSRTLHRHGHGIALRVNKYLISFWHPLRMDDIGGWDTLPNVENALRKGQPFGGVGPGVLTNDEYLHSRSLATEAESWAFLRKKIEDAGYDAIVYRNAVEDAGKDSYIVWNAKQIERIG